MRRDIDWPNLDWTLADRELSRRLGCAPSVVWYHRHRLGRPRAVAPGIPAAVHSALRARGETNRAVVADMLADGDAVPDIARVLKVSPRDVYWLAGAKSRKPRVTDAERLEIARLLRTGLSRRACAAKAGRTRKVIDKVAEWMRGRELT